MPTKLKGLKIKRVALVDEGANPDAYIKFAKSKGAEPDVDVEIDTEQALGLIDRFAGLIRKMFKGEKIDKSAFTFAEAEEQLKRDYDGVMTDEVYPMFWAATDSVYSILFDKEKTDDEKASLLKQTISEFSSAFIGCADAWAKAEHAETNIEKDADTLAKIRDNINSLIEKAADGGEEQPGDEEDDDNDDDEDEPEDEDTDDKEKDGGQPPVKKGVTNMEFDTSKMTPEEKAQYDDLCKRYGKAEGEAQVAPAPAATPAPATEDSDVVKGMKAELDELRKFRQEAEDRELGEVAKRYTIIGKKPEELIPVLKSLKATSQEAYDSMIAGLDSAVEAVEKSGMFSEIGKSGKSGSSTEGAWAKIEAAAQEIVKNKPGMRWADAVDAACMEHPELVAEYEKSR